MSDSIDFSREVALNLSTSDRWLNPLGREVRAFVRAPEKGMNEETGVCLLLHGRGGRQNDIAWKRLRRDVANAHNMLVVGVNFIGTHAFLSDEVFLHQEVEHAIRAMRSHPGFQASQDGGLPVLVDGEDVHVSISQYSAAMARQAYPFDYWDWGVIQCLDVINALHWAIESAGISPRRRVVFSTSAGGQIGYNLLKFWPAFTGAFVDLGGVCFAGDDDGWQSFILEDPFGRLGDGDQGHVHIKRDDLACDIKLFRRTPKPMLGFEIGTGAAMSDEVALRQVTRPDHFVEENALQMLSAECGADDELFAREHKESAVDFWRARGVDASLKVIGEAEIDGRKRRSALHSFYKDFGAILLEDYADVFALECSSSSMESLLGNSPASFETPRGRFVLERGKVSKLRFEKREGV